MNELKLTVQDVLARDLFKQAKVVAGKKGLDRQVKWSHVLEVKEFDSLDKRRRTDTYDRGWLANRSSNPTEVCLEG